MPLNASYAVMLKLETTVILQVGIGDVLIKIAMYSFQWGITKVRTSFRTWKATTVILSERANELSEKGKIDVIAQNSEKIITFAFRNLCFKDSFNFLSSSLDKLVNLSKYGEENKKEQWQKNFKFSQRNPYISDDED